jgi:hypothetical protein
MLLMRVSYDLTSGFFPSSIYSGLILNLSDSKPIWFLTYLIPNLSDFEPIRFQTYCTYLVLNLFDIEPI